MTDPWNFEFVSGIIMRLLMPIFDWREGYIIKQRHGVIRREIYSFDTPIYLLHRLIGLVTLLATICVGLESSHRVHHGAFLWSELFRLFVDLLTKLILRIRVDSLRLDSSPYLESAYNQTCTDSCQDWSCSPPAVYPPQTLKSV